jgi:Ca2+:H+ antiporter
MQRQSTAAKRAATEASPLRLLASRIRGNPVLWLLIAVPLPLAGPAIGVGHTGLFALSVVAIVPLAAFLSLATESVAEKLGDAKGGLLNATLGNLTELIIALTALRAGEYLLVKASLAGVIVTNTLFMLGASFLIGGLKYHVQEYNRANSRVQVGMLFLSTFALLIPSAVGEAGRGGAIQTLSLGIALLLILTYCLGLIFTLRTHRAFFEGHAHGEGEEQLPLWLALVLLAAATVLVALVSEVFVESIEGAALDLGMSAAFVGFVVVALVGGAAEMVSAFSGALRNRLDLSVGIAFGSATQIALFVAPVLVVVSYMIGPTPMDLQFWPGAIVMMFVATLASALIATAGRSAWFLGVLMIMVYLVFALTLYALPPAEPA